MYYLNWVFFSLHLFGAMLWVGGLVSTAFVLGAAREDRNLAGLARKLARFADAGATLAILFGVHWLFKQKLYTMPYMHVKFALLAILIGLHGFIRVKAKKMATQPGQSLPGFALPLVMIVSLGIVVVVLLKLPK